MMHHHLPYRNVLLTVLALLMSFSWDSCARNPVTGKNQLMLMSAGQEQAMGDQTDPAIVAQFPL